MKSCLCLLLGGATTLFCLSGGSINWTKIADPVHVPGHDLPAPDTNNIMIIKNGTKKIISAFYTNANDQGLSQLDLKYIDRWRTVSKPAWKKFDKPYITDNALEMNFYVGLHKTGWIVITHKDYDATNHICYDWVQFCISDQQPSWEDNVWQVKLTQTSAWDGKDWYSQILFTDHIINVNNNVYFQY